MDMVPLSATARLADASPRGLRRSGQVPCVLYGNVANQPIQCDATALWKVYEKAGESTLVDLDVGGKKIPVLIHDIDFEPVSDKISHVDFYAVDMKKEIEASVPLHFEGESRAVKEEGGVLVAVLDHVTVVCLPSDLPHALAVSIDKLVNFHDNLTVADIPLPGKVKIKEEPDVVIATVQEPRKEEVIVPATPAEGEVAAAPVEGAPAAEGAAAAAPAAALAAEKKGKKEA